MSNPLDRVVPRPKQQDLVIQELAGITAPLATAQVSCLGQGPNLWSGNVLCWLPSQPSSGTVWEVARNRSSDLEPRQWGEN